MKQFIGGRLMLGWLILSVGLASAALIASLALLGCGSGQPNRVSHLERTVRLSANDPDDRTIGFSLARVEPDGTTVIRVHRTGEILMAGVGQPFLGRPIDTGGGLPVRAFGEHGLTLESSDALAQTAVFVARWAEN